MTHSAGLELRRSISATDGDVAVVSDSESHEVTLKGNIKGEEVRTKPGADVHPGEGWEARSLERAEVQHCLFYILRSLKTVTENP